jgi:hypothetical protein
VNNVVELPTGIRKKAYLVAHMRTDPPRIVGCGIYSEPARSLSGAIGHGVFAFDVCEDEAGTFDGARARILKMAEPYRSIFAWAIDMVPAGER